ncbi:MAG: alpha-amylase family glycosyl hydrolase [Chitinophagaceae bacterium]
MKRLLLVIAVAFASSFAHAQLLTWTPDFAKDNDNITITMDATKGNQGLNNYADPNDVYVHVGLITSASSGPTNWLYAPFAWGSTAAAAKATSLGNNKYSYTINNIRNFFFVPAGETIYKIAILFRNGTGSLKQANTDGGDMYVPVYDNTVAVRFTVPPFQPKYIPEPEPITKAIGDNIALTAIANKPATLNLYLNGNLIQTAAAATSISANPTLTSGGNTTIMVEAIDGAVTKKDSVKFFVSGGITVAPLPAGVQDGINYLTGNTSVVLVLYAPGKNRVSVIGEFPGNNWTEQSTFQMNKTPDGNRWWLQINGLTPGTEYAYQYIVDGTLKIADPYTEKVLDPNNDGGITADVYPGLRSYPAGQTGIVSLLQTAAPAYTWRNTGFTGPDKRNLIIYEVLLRDFTDAHRWQTMIDTLSYLQRLGINAVELMPVTEFEGNDSWGYNPSFSFAPDKYYGTKNKLKEFIDSCHSKQIAVIMDVVPNHCYNQSPLAQLYWNAAQSRPAPDNPWLNPVQPHAFGFGNDFNHESTATKYFWKRMFDFWVREYRMDGFRMDFTKGLTQKASSDDGQFSAYDQTRVDILRTYADTIWKYFPNTYIILEHLAAKNEEQTLQGMGFLLWGGKRENVAYNEATMGFNESNKSNFSSVVYNSADRGFTNPYLVGYMESHDEERLMYKNITFGNSASGYDAKNDSIALRRVEAATSLFLTIPGPKMIWQFGERGYDKSIFACTDNSIPQPYGNESCKLSRKEPRWQHMQDTKRKRLYNITASLIRLRTSQPALFNSTSFTYDLVNAVKYFKISEPTLGALIVANFGVTASSASVSFPTAGTWYDYLTGETIGATGVAQTIPLQAGEYHVYLSKNLGNVAPTAVFDINAPLPTLEAAVYPNPATRSSVVEVNVPETGKVQIMLYNMTGMQVGSVFSGTLARGIHFIPLLNKINNLPGGTYLLKVQSKNQFRSLKTVVQ